MPALDLLIEAAASLLSVSASRIWITIRGVGRIMSVVGPLQHDLTTSAKAPYGALAEDFTVKAGV
ncbi:MAG: hypothetical protein R3C20_16500 [Planctomycetaceae bacterium]